MKTSEEIQDIIDLSLNNNGVFSENIESKTNEVLNEIKRSKKDEERIEVINSSTSVILKENSKEIPSAISKIASIEEEEPF
jgi:hypothetical protein